MASQRRSEKSGDSVASAALRVKCYALLLNRRKRLVSHQGTYFNVTISKLKTRTYSRVGGAGGGTQWLVFIVHRVGDAGIEWLNAQHLALWSGIYYYLLLVNYYTYTICNTVAFTLYRVLIK